MSQTAPAPHERLTDRELEILCLIGGGKTARATAEQLGLSVHTVGAHRVRMLEKMGLDSTAALMRYAIENNLVP